MENIEETNQIQLVEDVSFAPAKTAQDQDILHDALVQRVLAEPRSFQEQPQAERPKAENGPLTLGQMVIASVLSLGVVAWVVYWVMNSL